MTVGLVLGTIAVVKGSKRLPRVGKYINKVL